MWRSDGPDSHLAKGSLENRSATWETIFSLPVTTGGFARAARSTRYRKAI